MEQAGEGEMEQAGDELDKGDSIRGLECVNDLLRGIGRLKAFS